jgi:hypothetical protein
MKNQDYVNIVTSSRRKFLHWTKEKYVRFKSLQHLFPKDEGKLEITNIIFYNKDSDINEYDKDGSTSTIIKKFKELLQLNGLPMIVIDAMVFEIDSDENVKLNYDGNYFNRIEK